MPALNTNDATSWLNWVTNFDRTYALFTQTLEQLRSRQEYVLRQAPHLSNRFLAQLNQGNTLARRMADLKNTRDRVVTWLNSIGQSIPQFAGASLDWLKNNFGLGGLGVAPIYIGLGLTAAAAAIAAAAYWVNETVQLMTVIDEARRLENRGLSPEAAARQAQSYNRRGFSLPTIDAGGIAGIPWAYLAAGAAALVLLPMLIKRRA